MVRMIDADKLIEEIESYRGDIFVNEVIELIKQFPEEDATNTKDGNKWIPADHPPETDENNSSEDVIVKVKWWDDDITYDVGYYRKKNMDGVPIVIRRKQLHGFRFRKYAGRRIEGYDYELQI